MRFVEAFIKFVAPNSQELPLLAMPVTILARDVYLQDIKNYAGPTITLEKAKSQMV